MDGLMTVGELARRLGVTVRTLQYYDRIGLVNPSRLSEGGRRLYSAKDMLKVHQVLSMKRLGFSLDEIKSNLTDLTTPQAVLQAFEDQEAAIEGRIKALCQALKALRLLKDEVKKDQEVDFERYADLVILMERAEAGTWAWQHFDRDLKRHVKDRYMLNERAAMDLYGQWNEVSDEIVALSRANIPHDSPKAQAVVARFWGVVEDFTGGDMTLLPKLLAFGQSQGEWNEVMKTRQALVDAYLEKAIEIYFENQTFVFPTEEG